MKDDKKGTYVEYLNIGVAINSATNIDTLLLPA